MLVASMWMDAVAQALGMPLHTLQECNMYGEGAVTHFGQELVHNRLPACWQRVTETSDYHKRRKQVDEFNVATRCAQLAADLVHYLRWSLGETWQ